MKKYLLLASIASITFTSQAQDRRLSVDKDLSHLMMIDQEPINALIKKNIIPNNKSVSIIPLGTSFNIYSILGDRQNQVVYNAAINTVAFSHRQNAGGPGGLNAPGIISLDYSTDGGDTWTINPYQTTSTGSGTTWNGNRYPNMAIYNPVSNTTPADAFMLEVGPVLETGLVSNNNGWAKTFRTSFKLDGSSLDETYDFNSVSALGDENEWGAAGLYVTSQGTAWYVTTNTNNTGLIPLPTHNVADNYSNYFIVRGDFNIGNSNFDWTVVDTITPTWNTTSAGTPASPVNMSGLPNMAWSVDGNTGYMVIMGSWGANTMYRPYVMKTTDAGTTWNNVNDFDFSQDPVLQQYIFTLNADPSKRRPFFSSFDMVVGSDNELRIFGEINSGFTDHADSLNFTFGSIQAGFLFEAATNGTGWDVTFIDSMYVEDYQWDGTNSLNLNHFVRPQASRSQDGTKVFYTWLGSSPEYSNTREFPDVWAVSHDISGNEPNPWSGYKNLSKGTSAHTVSAYQTVAVDAIESGSDQTWELALVYGTALGGATLTNGTIPAQWNFLKGVGFSAIDFTTAEGGNAGGIGTNGNLGNVSVNEHELENNTLVYPNPSNGAITILIANTTAFNYTIVDILGNTVKANHINGNRVTIDLTSNAKGVYFVKINNEKGTITKKIILTK